MTEHLLNFQDKDGSIRKLLNARLKREKAKYPDRKITASAIMREGLRKSLNDDLIDGKA